MRVLQRQRIERIRRRRQAQRVALPIEAAEHGIRQFARSHSVTAFRELHCLRDRGVGGNAPHVQQLERAEPEQIEQIGVEPSDTVAHALVQECVETRAAAQHAIHQLARPSSIARIEVEFVTDAAVE
jgi:hypothetical protein